MAILKLLAIAAVSLLLEGCFATKLAAVFVASELAPEGGAEEGFALPLILILMLYAGLVASLLLFVMWVQYRITEWLKQKKFEKAQAALDARIEAIRRELDRNDALQAREAAAAKKHARRKRNAQSDQRPPARD